MLSYNIRVSLFYKTFKQIGGITGTIRDQSISPLSSSILTLEKAPVQAEKHNFFQAGFLMNEAHSKGKPGLFAQQGSSLHRKVSPAKY